MTAGEQQAGPARPSSVQEREFFPVDLAVMQPGTAAPVDLYLRQEGAYVLYKKAEAALTEQVRQRLLENGVELLYMRTEDEEAFHEYLADQAGAILEDDLMPAEHLMPVMYQASTRVMKDLFADPRSGENMKRAAEMARSLVDSILQSPEPLKSATQLMSHDYYTYTHSVNVCIFLVASAKELADLDDKESLYEVGCGGIFHDLGKSQVPKTILNKPGKLTDEEFDQIKKHPVDGLKLVGEQFDVTERAKSVIRGHHERFDGTGYPDRVPSGRLDTVVQLSTVVDVYDALTTNRSYADARTPYDALHLMVNGMQGHFCQPLLRAFIRFLGPKEAPETQ